MNPVIQEFYVKENVDKIYIQLTVINDSLLRLPALSLTLTHMFQYLQNLCQDFFLDTNQLCLDPNLKIFFENAQSQELFLDSEINIAIR